MPYYYITILLFDGKQVRGVKEYLNNSIEIAYRHFQADAVKYYRGSQIKEFDCMMISRQSKLYKSWMKAKQIKKGMIEDPIGFLNNDNLSKGPSILNQRRSDIYKDKKNHWSENIIKDKND